MTPVAAPAVAAPRHLLVCVDVHDDDSCALAHGLVNHAGVIAHALGARVTVLAVLPPSSTPAAPPVGGDSAAYRGLLARAELQSASWRRTLATLTDRLRAPGLDVVSRVVESDAPAAEVIVDVAGGVGADLVIVGSHSRHGIARAVLGSVAERTAAHAAVPVMIVPRSALR